jgi:hypothetical protein
MNSGNKVCFPSITFENVSQNKYTELLKSNTFVQPKIKTKRVLKARRFITELVQLAVKNHNNPINNPKNIYHWFIKISSNVLAFIYRFFILLFLKTGLASSQMKRVFRIG